MKRTVFVLLFILANSSYSAAETQYGLELAPQNMQQKHLAHFMELFQHYCVGKGSGDEVEKALLGSGVFRPAEGFEGIYEMYFEGISYAVTPANEVCTVDVMLEYEPGKLLFTMLKIISAISDQTGFFLRESEEKTEEGDNSADVLTVQSRFRSAEGKEEVVLTYPTSNQGHFYMTLDYPYH